MCVPVPSVVSPATVESPVTSKTLQNHSSPPGSTARHIPCYSKLSAFVLEGIHVGSAKIGSSEVKVLPPYKAASCLEAHW